MKTRIVALFTFLLFLQFWSCNKEPERLDNYLVEFATTYMGNTYHFILDNGDILTPIEVKDINKKNGQRIILKYTPLGDGMIKIIQIAPILTGEISYDILPDIHNTDPIKLQSVWVGGNYLNIIFEIEYNSKVHNISLHRDTNSPEIDLYLIHSLNNDSPGYPRIMYSSFLIDDIRTETDPSPTPFRLHINTHSGIRQINLKLR